jgi:ribonuclease-3 family protein
MDSNLNSYSSASLAYLGDCALEICVREYLVRELGLSSSAKLNKVALDFVRAPKQAEAMKNILPLLSEEEEAVFKRGRNVGHTNTPKSATVSEYRSATGMETLFGWLWLAGRRERIEELFRAAYKLDENN